MARGHLALGGRHFCNRGPAGFSGHPDRSPYAACVSLSRSEARCASTSGEFLQEDREVKPQESDQILISGRVEVVFAVLPGKCGAPFVAYTSRHAHNHKLAMLLNFTFSGGRVSKILREYPVLFLQAFSLLLAVATAQAQGQPGLFVNAPAPIITRSISDRLPYMNNYMSISMSFGQDGNVRETSVVKSSGLGAADKFVQKWITTRWKARPEVMRAGFYRGRPVTEETRFIAPLDLVKWQ